MPNLDILARSAFTAWVHIGPARAAAEWKPRACRARVAGQTRPRSNGLLLKQTKATGPGVFGKITFIQRTNTTGGLAPTEPGALNELREVPYTAEYYFYRAEGPVGQ